MGGKHDENDGTENKQEQSQQSQPDVKAETSVKTVNVQTTDKSSIVAEPQPRYSMMANAPRFPARQSGICQSTIDRSGFNVWSVYCFSVSTIKLG